ncbi:MAG: hypothetical protein QF408_06750 [Pirellulales bacterium]|jgi:hypothetical protein|nr:hypothetical protein [Pirellulales bacterium]HJN67296.1 hypothetical protein [Pirellulales bacterium]
MCKQVRSSDSESAEWLQYVLAFSAFALIALALVSGKIKTRQAAIEQQFHGIQQMQQSGGANSEQPLKSPDEIPARITLRPLMLILGVVLGLAWLGLIVRKVRRRNVVRRTTDEREPDHDRCGQTSCDAGDRR